MSTVCSIRVSLQIAGAVAGLVGGSWTMAADTPETASFERVLVRAATEDSRAASTEILRGDDPIAAARKGSRFVLWLYDQKRIPEMVLYGQLGIDYCLGHATSPALDEPRRTELRGLAKTIAYNVSANLWPGWNDGVALTAADLRTGLDLARLNLRLGVELKRGAEPMGHAHWLVGAHELAAGQLDRARAAFQESSRQFEAANKPDAALMAQGYAALTAGPRVASPTDPALQELLKRLRALDGDGPFFADQIETAARVFAK